uniref:C2H2-type domain-containing protein n=1 Tax=Culex tarsalis TaxID=7177 RepID=A0A1Q3F7X9_CULTA
MDCPQKDPILELTSEELIIEDVLKLEQPKLELVSDSEEVPVQNEPIVSDSEDAKEEEEGEVEQNGICDRRIVPQRKLHSTLCCKLCRKEFFSRTHLEQHQKECQIISEVEILQDGDISICPRCFKTFASKIICIRHIHYHKLRLRQKLRKKLENNQESEQIQLLKCSECPKQFKSQVYFRRHMQMHADLRAGTYKCKTCGKHFRINTELIDHSLTAHGKFQMAVPGEQNRKLKIPMRTEMFSKPKKGTFRSRAITSSQRREWKVV